MFSARTLNATIPEVENVSAISFCISEVSIKFWIFWKKGWGSWFRYFPSFRLQKTWLPKCLKSLVSVYPKKMKMLKSFGHSWKMHVKSVVIFFSVLWKNFSSEKCLLGASKILRHFVEILTSNYKLSLSQ